MKKALALGLDRSEGGAFLWIKMFMTGLIDKPSVHRLLQGVKPHLDS